MPAQGRCRAGARFWAEMLLFERWRSSLRVRAALHEDIAAEGERGLLTKENPYLRMDMNDAK